LTERQIAELLVYDAEEACPYLDGNVARLPLRWPMRGVSRAQTDQFLAAGDRRSGPYLYHTQCPQCQACEPIRLNVAEFQMSRGQRRVLRRGDQVLETRIGSPECDERRIAMYNRHKQERGLDLRGVEVDAAEYQAFLVESCCETLEFSYWLNGELVGVAIIDRGENSLNAVYCFFDVEQSHLSIGTYSILKQVEWCREWQLRHLYLGLYVSGCRPMEYKADYLPHERLIDARWQRFPRVSDGK